MRRRRSRKYHFASTLFLRLADRAGVTVDVEPRWGHVGQVISPTGKVSYFRQTRFDLNTLGAVEVVTDKGYTRYFLQRLGYRVATGQTFYSRRWADLIGSTKDIDAAYRYARRLGFPVVVKPNSLSQGTGVSVVHTRKEFYNAAKFVLECDRVMLVERVLPGRDYRVVVLDGEVLSAYERLRLSVTGDGRSSIHALLVKKQRAFQRAGRNTVLQLDDFRIPTVLKRKKLTFESVLPKGTTVTLLDNANLSTGGESVDVTEEVHPDFQALARNIAHDMNLRFCGVDLMIEGDIREPLKRYGVIEVNGAPGIDHYASSGARQQRIVDDLYVKVLQAMAR